MTGADAITVVVCVFFGAAALSLTFAEPVAKLRAKRAAKAAAAEAVLAGPIKLPVTPANRAMRKRRANVVWHWVLDERRALPEPVPARGALGFWRPAADTLAAVLRQIGAAR